MTIFGMTRVKNEGRWIKQVLESYLPLCERIWVFDDHSGDGTPEIAEKLDERITVLRSQFPENVLDEKRDKDLLLSRVMGSVSDIHLRGNPKSPFWALAFDGDELLDMHAPSVIHSYLATTNAYSFKLPIRYQWDSDLSLVHLMGHRRVRVDGVYGTFARPSIFRLFNAAVQYQSTPWGGNFHCSSSPPELLGCAHETLPATIWHLGYNDRADRVRKFQWYSNIDPNNPAEDRYRHMIAGDVPVNAPGFPAGFEVPADAKLKHAGPLKLEMM